MQAHRTSSVQLAGVRSQPCEKFTAPSKSIAGQPPNNLLKPTPLRSGHAVAEKACHGVASTTLRVLAQALGLMRIFVAFLFLIGTSGCATADRFDRLSAAIHNQPNGTFCWVRSAQSKIPTGSVCDPPEAGMSDESLCWKELTSKGVSVRADDVIQCMRDKGWGVYRLQGSKP